MQAHRGCHCVRCEPIHAYNTNRLPLFYVPSLFLILVLMLCCFIRSKGMHTWYKGVTTLLHLPNLVMSWHLRQPILKDTVLCGPKYTNPPPPFSKHAKNTKRTVKWANVLRQARACTRRAVAKERLSPNTCLYLNLTTIVATRRYNTMCTQISACSRGPHCPSGASAAVA